MGAGRGTPGEVYPAAVGRRTRSNGNPETGWQPPPLDRATEHARVLFQEASDDAWEMGRLAFAAHTNLDAAVVSAELKMGRHIVAATQGAEPIAGLPEMPQQGRLAVETRLDLLGVPRHVSEIMLREPRA